jgi:hypothetical protein
MKIVFLEVHMLVTPVDVDVGYKSPKKQIMQLCSHSPNTSNPYAEALTLANDFRTSKRACFLNRRTLNRSKSVNARLRSF